MSTTWERTPELAEQVRPRTGQRRIYLFAGLVMIGIVGYLIISGLGARYYMTVDELMADPGDNLGKKVRLAGAVDGDYQYDQSTQTLTFVVAHIPRDNDEIRDAGGLDAVLEHAVDNKDLTRLRVVYENAEIPDLLQNKAQAIMTGELHYENGEYIFYAEELQLKCPSRHSDEGPKSVEEEAA